MPGAHEPIRPRTAEEIRDELRVLAAQQGDERAFAELVARWQPSLLSHAFRLTGSRDSALDAVQETWLAVVRALPRLDDPARFGGFVHRILARRCADWTRLQQRRRRADARAGREEAPAEAARGAGRVEAASDVERLREHLATLRPDRRVLLSLRYLHDLPIASIAATLRIPPGTVKSRLHEARTQLARALEGRRTPCPRSTT